jgi:hypothetical protein
LHDQVFEAEAMSCAALAAIGLHLLSWHSAPQYNDVTPGFYARSSCGLVADTAQLQDGVQAGGYYNSERRWSFYAGYVIDAKPLPRAPWFGVFGSVAVATGYKEKALLPIALVGVTAQLDDDWRLRAGYAPKAGKLNDTHLITTALEYVF